MPKIRDNAEILRALGRFLDDQGATTFEIVNHIAYLAVAWDSPNSGSAPSERAYQDHHLNDLRAEARGMRQGAEGPVGSLVELLRIVGQELDRERVDLSSIRRDERAFHVSGSRDGRHYQAEYRTKDLVVIGANRRAARGQSPARPEREQVAAEPERDPGRRLYGVVIGARVFDEEGELIGQVTDVRSRYFKVAKNLRDEGYWLPAESIGAITHGGDVLLSPLA
jgi:hypothetical protein